MDKFLLVPLHLLPELLWLQVRLCQSLDAEDVSSWLLRLRMLLKAHGLQGAISTSRIVVMGVRQLGGDTQDVRSNDNQDGRW